MPAWDATNPEDWTRAFGLVPVPYFGPNRTDIPSGNHSVMQDGPAASFALHVGKSNAVLEGKQPLAWAWSANVRHSVLLDRDTKEARIRRWDDSHFGEVRSLTSEREAGRFITDLESSRLVPTGRNVIEKTLNAFSTLRGAIEQRQGSATDVILAFNAAILLADEYRDKPNRIPSFTLERAVRHFLAEGDAGFRHSISDRVADYGIGEFARLLLEEGDADSPYMLDTDVLIRHASGQLYQELHRQLVNAPSASRQQRLFDDVLPTIGKRVRRHRAPRYVHHTPAWLARALVEESIRYVRTGDDLTIFDPACGSGIFLIEAARELERVQGCTLALHGADESVVAGIMAEFCVSETISDIESITANANVQGGVDSLGQGDWGSPDIILMNPPYKSWGELNASSKANVKKALGAHFSHRPDLYLAFLAKAAASLQQGGVLACVIPSAFFGVKSTKRIRALFNGPDFRVRMIGVFQGFKTFYRATVEAAVLVVAKSRVDAPIRMLIAEKGQAEKAVRLLRTLGETEEATTAGVEAVFIENDLLRDDGWIVRAREDAKFAEALSRSTPTRVEDLFTVHLGMRGIGARKHKKLMLLSEDQYEQLVRGGQARRYFRPAADEIENGCIVTSRYIFYPYSERGELLLRTEAEVAAALPAFFANVLLPAREALQNRRDLQRNWWEPARPLLTWLAARSARIVSKEHGNAGEFAFDSEGKFAVVGGHGWCWNGPNPSRELYLAYLALFNSRVFDRLLGVYCPRLQGGQYKLAAQFVNRVPLPDLRTSGEQLASIGAEIHDGDEYDDAILDAAVLAAYGVVRTKRASQRRPLLDPAATEFHRLVSEWKKGRSAVSTAKRMAAHPAYQSIIAMGLRAVPLIVEEMQREPDHWFIALHSITGASPVPEADRGDIGKMTEAWVNWWSQRNGS